jgi:ABC-type branched-subunit amino acid transport system substrate-binding protein
MGLEQEIYAILNHIDNSLYNKIGVLCCKIPAYETLVKDYIETYFNKETNRKLVYKDFYDLNQIDFKNQITQLKQANVDCLILLGYGFEYHNIYKNLDEQSILNSFQIMGGWGFLYTEISTRFLENTLVAGPQYVFEKNENSTKFKDDFKKKFGYIPNFDAAFAY